MTSEEIRKFRNSGLWHKIRARILMRDPFCVPMLTHDTKLASTQVDHIVPIHKGGSATADDNLQGICDDCHARKTLIENTTTQFTEFCIHGFPLYDPSGAWTCTECN